MDKVEDSQELEAKPNINKEENIIQKEDKENDNKENKTDINNDDSLSHQKQNNINISKVTDTDNDIQTSTPNNSNENARSQKKSAMSRMRNNVKNTLFVGITKKINPDGANQNDSTQNNGQQMYSDSTFKQNIMNSANQGKYDQNKSLYSNQRDQSQQNHEHHHHHVSCNMANSSKTDQCPRIEFSFGCNNATHNKFRTNDPLLIFQESEQVSKKDSSIINQTRTFEENYELLNDKLGEGCHGDVRKCRHKETLQLYAVKMIRNGDTEIILSAITSFKIAKNLNHPSIIKPYELFINRETEKIFYVMEFCEYGSLQDYIEDLWNLSPHKKDRSINKRRAASVEYFDQDVESQNNLEFQEKSRRKKSLGDHQRISRRKLTQKTESVNDMLLRLQQQNGNNDNNQENNQNEIKYNNEEIKVDSQVNKNEDTINQKQEDLNQESKVNRKKVQFTQQTGSRIEQDSVKKILKEILLAVDYLHSEGICHRDLKPDNILISKDLQNVKIIDFEISKQFKFFRQNRSGVLKVCEMWTRTGTQDFMSPEMFESTGYTEAVDIWAIGVIAYFLLTGRLPFDQEYISDKIEFIRNAQYNLEYMRDLDDIPRDFIRRMLKKDPNERLTAQEALSHPWFLVSSNIENRNRIDTINKSNAQNIFHSPQDNDKFFNQDSALFKEINIRGNQSTVLMKRDTTGNESMLYHTNTQYLNKGNINRNQQGNNYSLSSKNCSKGRGSKIISEFDVNGDLNQNLEGNEVNQMSESSKIISEIKRTSKQHATEIGKSPQSGNKTSKRGDMNGHNQVIKQSFFYDENNQSTKNQGDSSCRGLKNPQNKSLNLNMSNFRDSSHLYENTRYEKLDQLINGRQEESEGEESEKDDSYLKKKKEFKRRIKQFKDQMSIGIMSDKFIHINQKQIKHPQVSQLRFRLLQEKTLQKTNSSDKNTLSQIKVQTANENKGEYLKSSGIHSSSNNLTSNTNINGTQINGISSFNNLNQQNSSSQSISTSNQLHFNFNNQTLSNNGYISGVNNGSNNQIQNLNSVNSSTQNITNNNQNTTSNSSINISLLNLNNLQINQLSQEQPKQSFNLQLIQNSQTIVNPQLFLDNNTIDLQNLRSRSNTNDLQDKNELEEQIETRAKRLSEDFTSSCIIYNPQRQQQIQNIIQQSLHSSLQNGSQQDGKVQKQSLFSSNQYTQVNNNNNSNLMHSTNFNINNSKQLTFQEQLQLKPINFVRDFLISTGSLKERDEVDEQQKKESLETSVNPLFKKIDSDEETPTNDQADLVFKRVMSSNSSNTENITVTRQHKSSSDVCSIASELQINIDQNQIQDQIKNDQNIPSSQIIQSSSEESFQIDDEDDI